MACLWGQNMEILLQVYNMTHVLWISFLENTLSKIHLIAPGQWAPHILHIAWKWQISCGKKMNAQKTLHVLASVICGMYMMDNLEEKTSTFWWDSKCSGTSIYCSLLLHDITYSMMTIHDDVIKWKYFPCYRPFVQGIHWSPVNSPHKGQ